MAEPTEEFTNLGLKKRLGTKLKVAILARSLGIKQFVLVDMLVNDAWALAKKAKLVTDEMIDVQAHWVGDNEEYTEEDVEKIMKALKGKK